MKTLTVTFHHTTNYGASLQAYALQRKIKSLGHDNVVFEYPDSGRYYSRIRLSNPRRALISSFFNVTKFFRKKEHLRLRESFKQFKKNNMQLTRVFSSIEDLQENTPDVDCLITGSDQVWNMRSNRRFKPAHFLDFGDKNLKRFSYAASIEKLNYTEEQKEYVNNVLESFDGISVREQSAKEYIESFSNHNPKVVLDPVFLLTKEEWRTIAKEPRVKGAYILVYQVLSNPNMQKVVNKLSRDTGYPIVSVNNGTHRWIRADYTFFDVSPEELIGLYDDAAIVVSTSFHGTALGLIFNKPTYSLIKGTSSNRASDLLNKIEMSEFLISSLENLPEPRINVEQLNKNLDRERNNSIEFLKNMLDDK